MHISPRPVVLGFLFVFGALFTACNRDPQVQKQKYYNKALDLLKKGRVDSAKLELLNAVKIDQLYAEADSTLAEIYFRQANYKQAYILLQQALRGNPDYLPAHRGMAQFDLFMRKLPEAQKELEFVLDHTPDDVDTLMNLGRLQGLQNKPKDAEGTFNRVLEVQPGHVGALLALASVSQELKDLPAAESFLKLALEKNPRSVPVYLTLFKFYITTARPANAESLFPQALKDTNNNVEILEAQDGYYEGLHRFDEAEVIVKKIQTSDPKDQAFWGSLAEFYVRTKDLNKAKVELERVVKAHNDDTNDLHKLIEVNIEMGDRRTAESLTDALLEKNKEDNYAHLLKGRLALADGNIELATLELNKAQKFKADWPAAHFWVAQLFIRKGEFGQAKDELEKALAHDPGYRTARIILAALQNHTGAVGAALQNGIRLIETNPTDVSSLLVYSDSLILRKDYRRAEKVLKMAESGGAANNADLHRQLGILALAQKNVAAARKEFKTAWNLQPGSRLHLENVDLGYVVDGQLVSGIDFLHQAIVSRPKDAVLQFELAKMYLWRGQHPEAISALQTAMKIEPANPESDILLANVYAVDKQVDQAVKLLTGATHKTGATAYLLMEAGMVYERMQRWDDARDTYERSIAMDSSNAIAKNNLASVLVDHGGDLNVALTLAAQAKEAIVDSPEISSTLGWIYYKRQLYPLAYKYLADCAGKDQKNPVFQYQLGMTQLKMGNPAEARRLLKKALALDAHFPGAADATSALSQIGPG